MQNNLNHWSHQAVPNPHSDHLLTLQPVLVGTLSNGWSFYRSLTFHACSFTKHKHSLNYHIRCLFWLVAALCFFPPISYINVCLYFVFSWYHPFVSSQYCCLCLKCVTSVVFPNEFCWWMPVVSQIFLCLNIHCLQLKAPWVFPSWWLNQGTWKQGQVSSSGF